MQTTRRPLLTQMPYLLAVLVLFLAAPLAAQKKDEFKDITKEDPFTKGDPAKMKALGVVRYRPFPWADHVSTADVDKVLGEDRILWMETEHFRFGFNMKSGKLPEESKSRKDVYAECKRLNKKNRKIPKKPKRLSPWLHLHLYAQRCEQAYAEFEQLVGVTETTFDADSREVGSGPYLGLPDKFLVLLFQKKSDMARYMKRYCDLEVDDSMRYFHRETKQLLLSVSADGMEGFDPQGIHGHVLYGLWQNLLNGYRGYHFPLPMWFSTGLAHYYSRRVKTKFVNARVQDTESVDQDTQNKWVQKVFRRSRHEGATIPFAKLNDMHDWRTFGFHAHTQCWSRLDFLMDLDPQKVGLVVDRLKRVPASGDWEGQGAALRRMMPKLLFDAFEMNPEAFDQRWRQWVLKVYPKRKD
ncbi:MAG: hypothetical protein AB8H80_02895 [Planctomycetota bacterium]